MLFDPLQLVFIIFLLSSGLWRGRLAGSLPLNKRLWAVLALIFTSEDSFHARFMSSDDAHVFSKPIRISILSAEAIVARLQPLPLVRSTLPVLSRLCKNLTIYWLKLTLTGIFPQLKPFLLKSNNYTLIFGGYCHSFSHGNKDPNKYQICQFEQVLINIFKMATCMPKTYENSVNISSAITK